MSRSGAREYGKIFSAGRRHAASPASAADAPINRRNCRRETPPASSAAPSGNSRATASLNSAESASSARLRQSASPSDRCRIDNARVSSVAPGAMGRRAHLSPVGRDGRGPRRRGVRLPGHIGDLPRGAQRRPGVAMAVEAPAHGERLFLCHPRHLVDAPVARGAADAGGEVRRVVEVDELGACAPAPRGWACRARRSRAPARASGCSRGPCCGSLNRPVWAEPQRTTTFRP